MASDEAVLETLGRRLGQRRLTMGMTQAELADEAGVSKRTVERVEAGASSQSLNLIRILRVLDLLEKLDRLVPATEPRPMDLLKLKGRKRRRASPRRIASRADDKWAWGDDQ
jgi:transcriptional regulator with XRE-family HTH domain